MSDTKTIRMPVADNPGNDAVQIMILDSRYISTHTVGSSLTSHICDPSTDAVLISVGGAAGDPGILIGNGPIEELTDDNMIDLFPGQHPWGLPEGRRTIHWKAIDDTVVVKIQEGV